MATDQNWGNDFIQAYLGGVQQRLQREKQAQEALQASENLKLNQGRLKMEMEHIDQLHQAELAQQGFRTEELKGKILDQFKNGTRIAPPALENPVMPGDPIYTPMDAQNQLQQANPQLLQLLQSKGAFPGQIPNPDGNPIPQVQQQPYMGTSTPDPNQFVQVDPRIDPSGYLKIEGASNPDIVDKRTMKEKMIEAQLAVQTAGAIKQAELPSVNAAAEFKANVEGKKAIELEGVKAQTAKELRTQQDAAALERTKTTVEGQKAAATIRANATKYATDHKKSGPEQQYIENAAMQSVTGQGPMPGYAGNGLAIRNAIPKGYKFFTANDAEKLKAVKDVSVLFDYMQDHIKDLPDNQIKAFIDRMSAKIPGTDIANIYQAVFGRAANISHTYGGEIGRLSDPDVARAMGLLIQPGITKKQALERLNQIKLETSSKVLDHILGGQPAQQQLINLDSFGFDPSSFLVQGKDGNLHARYSKNSEGAWGVLDPKTLSYSVVK